MYTPSVRTFRLSALAALALVAGTVLVGTGLDVSTAASRKSAPKPMWGDFIPPAPFDQLVKQPDGTTFKAVLTPAEVGATLETLDGYTVTRGTDGYWRYATGRRGKDLLASGAVVGKTPPPAGVRPQVGRTRNAWLDPQGYDLRTEMLKQLRAASYKAQMQAAAEGEPRVFKFPVLMLATWWDEEGGQTEPQFQDGSDSPEYFKGLLDGFGGNRTGSLTEFYWEDSFGQFLVQVDVFGPFTSERSREDRCYYGGIEPGDDGGTDLDVIDDVLGIGGGGALGMTAEAVPQADPEVNFADYDNDGDNVVDFVGVIHSGGDMAVTGDPCNTWSHAIQMTLGAVPPVPVAEQNLGYPTSDGVFVDRVFTMPEFDRPGSQLNIGVATHEMLHALGEPDYYNTSYSSAGTGDWDIMSGGSYLGNPPGSNPSGFNPATRVFQGWVQPTVVTADRRDVKLAPRNVKPPGYTVAQPDPNLLLVSVKEIAVGEEDSTGYTWTEIDVYGVPKNPATGKYVIEGYYIENMSRTVNEVSIHPEMTRAPYFDRKLLASGIMVWHYDYWLRSNVYNGSNNAQTDPNRPQMDPVEFDFNDNTQELQLNKGRGNPDDLMFSAATGITSGTRMLQPGLPEASGEPQAGSTFAGAAIATVPGEHPLTIEDNPNNYLVRVRVTGTGDCKLQLLYDDRNPATGEADSGGVGDEELVQLVEPVPGDYIIRVTDFAGCANYTGSVEFLSPSGFLPTKGAGDTWSNWSSAATGWAFTNVGPKEADGLDHAADAGGDESITLDVVNLGATELDVSPGFITGDLNDEGGAGPLNVGRVNTLTVPVFNNGGKAASNVPVAIRSGSATGPVVASGTIATLAPYSREYFDFSFTPSQEGSLALYAVVDPAGTLTEVHEGNNVQKTRLWAGPASPTVLVVDDDGVLDGEESSTGALAALGIPYAVVTEHPSEATLKAYDAVVWEVGGDRGRGQLDRDDRAAVRGYLNSGGKLLLTSPRIVNALGELVGRTAPEATVEAQDTLKQYFGADVFVTAAGLRQGPMINNVDLPVVGTGDLLGSGAYTISQIPGRHVYDVMRVADYAAEGAPEQIGTPTPLLKPAEAPEGQFLGMKFAGDAAHQNFKTVLLGYNLYQHIKADEYVSVMSKVMDYFGIAKNAYTVTSAEPLIYHTAIRDQVAGRDTHIRAVVLGGAADRPVTLYYRRHGQGGYYSAPMVRGTQPGTYHAVIPGEGITPDGADYYLKAGVGSTYDPPGAGRGVLAHAVGIGLPEVRNALPVLPGGPAVTPEPPPPAAGPGPTLPATGLPGAVPALAALLTLAGVVGVGRRRRP